MIIGKIKKLFNKIKEKIVPKEIEISNQKVVEKRQSMIKQLKKNK
jgi:hypothetical protein